MHCNGDGVNLCGEVEEGSNEEVEEKPIRELLPGIYRFILRHILFRHIFFCQKYFFDIYSGTVDDFRVQTDLPGEGQAVHNKGGCEPVEVPEEK